MRVRAVMLLAVTSGTAALASLLGEGWRVADVPTVLGGGSAPLTADTFLPVLPAIAAAVALGSRHRLQERVLGRRRTRWDLGLLALTLGGFAALAGTVSAAPLARDGLILIGLAAAVTCWGGASAGVFAVTALVLLTCAYSPSNPGARYARILQEDAHPSWAWCVAAGLVVAASSSVLIADRTLARAGR